MNHFLFFFLEPAAPQNPRVKDLDKGEVVVQWDPLPIYKRGGVLKSYKVNYGISTTGPKRLFNFINL